MYVYIHTYKTCINLYVYNFMCISYTVNHCRIIKDHSTIEIRSYVQINAIVGVKSIAEGSNLTLQVRQAYRDLHTKPVMPT